MSDSGALGQPGVVPPRRERDRPFIGKLKASAADTGGSLEIIEYQGKSSDEIRAALAGKYDSIPAPAHE